MDCTQTYSSREPLLGYVQRVSLSAPSANFRLSPAPHQRQVSNIEDLVANTKPLRPSPSHFAPTLLHCHHISSATTRITPFSFHAYDTGRNCYRQEAQRATWNWPSPHDPHREAQTGLWCSKGLAIAKQDASFSCPIISHPSCVHLSDCPHQAEALARL